MWLPYQPAFTEALHCLILDYEEDSSCDTDMNVVMTGNLGLVEVQGTAEGMTFSRNELSTLLDMTQHGIQELIDNTKRIVSAGIHGTWIVCKNWSLPVIMLGK